MLKSKNNYKKVFTESGFSSGTYLGNFSVDEKVSLRGRISPKDLRAHADLDGLTCVIDEELKVGKFIFGVGYLCVTKGILEKYQIESTENIHLLEVKVRRDYSGKFVSDNYMILIPGNFDLDLVDRKRSAIEVMFGIEGVRNFVQKDDLYFQEKILFCKLASWVFEEKFLGEMVALKFSGVVEMNDAE